MNDDLLRAVQERLQKSTEFGYGITTADRYAKNVLDAVGLDKCYQLASTRTTSWDDVMKKAARTLVYSNTDMVTEEVEYTKRAGSSLKQLDDVELPKNTLMVFRHVLTTPRKDRDGDVLRTKGARVDPKLLLLWQHVHTLPIGKMLQVAEHNEKKLSLVSCIVDMNDLSHDCAVMIDNGMGRFSHGFRAIEFSKIKARDGAESGGFDVKDFEIMEASLVSVPSNTDAEVEDVMLGLVEGGKLTSPMMKEYGKAIRDHRPLQLKAGLDLSKISLPIDLKITLNGKEISHEDLEGAGAETGSGTKGEGADDTGLAKEADGSKAGKAEEATTDAKMKCPECGAMVPKAAKVCPECGYKFEEGAESSEDEDEMEDDELETKGAKFGRTFSRKNLTTLKEVHADVEELDLGDHVLSVRGRDITKGCKKKIKAMIDEYDIPDDGGVEEGKSFGVEDAMAMLIADATPSQRATVRKAFDTIEQVEKMNLQAKQYRALLGKGDLPGHPFRGNQYAGGGGGMMAPDRDMGSGVAQGGGGSSGSGSGNNSGGAAVISAASKTSIKSAKYSEPKISEYKDGELDVDKVEQQVLLPNKKLVIQAREEIGSNLTNSGWTRRESSHNGDNYSKAVGDDYQSMKVEPVTQVGANVKTVGWKLTHHNYKQGISSGEFLAPDTSSVPLRADRLPG